MIEIKNLSFSYNNKVIFDKLSVNIPKGKFVSIIGPNGCGKSTLLKLINNDLNYKQGEILIDGNVSTSLSPLDKSKLLAFNRQLSSQVFPFSCLDYVLMGRRPYKNRFEDYNKEDIFIVESVLKKTNTESFINKKLNEISGGELQRINFAKILVQNTPYIFLDESFSAMDVFYKIESLNTLKNEYSDKTIVCVMHDLNLVYTYSDYVILLDNGKVFKAGTPQEVLTEGNINIVYKIEVDYIDGKGFLFRR